MNMQSGMGIRYGQLSSTVAKKGLTSRSNVCNCSLKGKHLTIIWYILDRTDLKEKLSCGEHRPARVLVRCNRATDTGEHWPSTILSHS